MCAAIGSSFSASVMERFGACGDSLTAFIKFITGDCDRDVLVDDGITFSASSCTTHIAQHIVFSGVIADAAMVAEIIELDVHGRYTDT